MNSSKLDSIYCVPLVPNSYSVTACRGLSSSKHSGVLAIFNQEFVKIGVIDKKWGRFYTNLFDSRQEGDYDDFVSFDKDRVNNLYLEAGQFVTIYY
ncbi:MAG: HEPN domain-containing protein [Candidatus Desantisbacteria bacterium]